MQRTRRPKISAAVVRSVEALTGKSVQRVQCQGAERRSLGVAVEILVTRTAEAFSEKPGSVCDATKEKQYESAQYSRAS